MPRLIPAIAALAALVAAVPSGAQIGSGKIAYVTVGLHTMNPDGSGQTLIRPGIPHELANPQWSPDGSQVAFTAYETIERSRLVVMNADGSNEHDVATGRLALGEQPWSPGGTRIAYVKDREIYTASAAGGDEQRLTSDGRYSTAPAWSPTGQSLVYSSELQASSPERWELFVVGTDGSGPTQITSGGTGYVKDTLATWSPAGDAIAFERVVVGDSAIYVVQPNGTALQRLARVGLDGFSRPAWSPDGTRILYTSAENTGYSPPGGLGQEIFVVNADGSGGRRLTELAPRIVADGSPAWSPDGARILFSRGAALATMNPDGTCEDVIMSQQLRAGASWQAVSGGGVLSHKTCRAVAAGGHAEVSADQAHASFDAQIINDGTEPLTNVALGVRASISADVVAEPGSGCSSQPYVRCRLARVEAGQTVHFPLRVSTRRLYSSGIFVRVRLEVTADGPLHPTGAESIDVQFTTKSCTVQDPGRGWIGGTAYDDRICGRRGPDRIYPGGGKDVVLAGDGADFVYSADRRRDRVTCGHGRDRVVADRRDVVARDCERVTRR